MRYHPTEDEIPPNRSLSPKIAPFWPPFRPVFSWNCIDTFWYKNIIRRIRPKCRAIFYGHILERYQFLWFPTDTVFSFSWHLKLRKYVRIPQTTYNTRCCRQAIERYGMTECFCRMKVFASRLTCHQNEVNTSKHRTPRTISGVVWKLSNEISVCFSEDFCIFFGSDRRKNAQKWPTSGPELWYNLIQFLRFWHNSRLGRAGQIGRKHTIRQDTLDCAQ